MAARLAGGCGALFTGVIGMVGVGNELSGAGGGAGGRVATISGVGAMVGDMVGSLVGGPATVLVGDGNMADVPTSGAMRVNTTAIWVVSWARKLTPIKLKSTSAPRKSATQANKSV